MYWNTLCIKENYKQTSWKYILMDVHCMILFIEGKVKAVDNIQKHWLFLRAESQIV